MEGTAFLVRHTYEKDQYGQLIPVEELYEIYCHVESIGQKEFFSAGQNGLRADLKIVTNAVNYGNENEIEFNGQKYGIYRTYRRNESDEIELYCEWKGGISD